MKNFLALLLIISVTACGGSNSSNAESDSSSGESEWVQLFDGESFDGWKIYNQETMDSNWEIVDGALACNVGLGEENNGFSSKSIMTTSDWGNFEFEIEYKIAKGGNSGIFYHVVEKPEYGYDFVTGPEVQVLDDEFSRSESEPYKMVASNYAMHAPSDSKSPNPYMEWNKMKIVYDNGQVEHWLNGVKVLEFKEGSPDWLAKKAAGKWANSDTYAAFKEGAFSLQDHGDEVYYRNIRVRSLD